MKKWTKTAGLIFMAAASVYADRAIAAKPAKNVSSAEKSAAATEVKLLQEADPFAAAGGGVTAAAAPSTAPVPIEGAVAPDAAQPSQPTQTITVSADGSTGGGSGSAVPMQLNPDGTFSLNITAGADLVEQLRVIGFQAQMSIIPSKDVHGTLPAMDLYNVTVHEALDALLHANGYAWREKGKFIYVYSAKEIQEMEKAARVQNTQVFRLFYTPAANAVNMIKPVLSADAQVSFSTPAVAGIATGTGDVGGNSHAENDLLVVKDYPENLEKVQAVLKEIDRRPQQILIEATILRATLSEDNQLGVDFNVLGGVDFSTVTTQGAQITNSNIGTLSGGNRAHSAGTGNAFSSPINGGLKVGVVSQNVSVFVSALEGVTDTTILANPKVLALNKQKGEVIVGREDGYVTTTVTESSSTETIEFLKTGTRLIFRPFIGDDGYIRMEVHPEDSSGGLQTADNLPFKVTTEVTSNVMVKDGHTIVIGGLFRESSDSTKSQIPVLGNIPLAGALFRNQRDRTTREEVIILLTPHIVKDDAAYADVSAETLKDGEKLRVGVRKGMMFWGRERLAEMYYENAVAEMRKPKPNRTIALWNLNAATNLNPKFLEAINMKQELTGKQITASDNSTARAFVKRAMLRDATPATPPRAGAIRIDPVPTTNPAAVAEATQEQDAPTTAPALAVGELCETATTQPSESAVGVELAGTPTTAPGAETALTQEQDSGFGWSDLAKAMASGPTTAPTSRPAGSEFSGDETAVTEVPMQELPDLSDLPTSDLPAQEPEAPAANK